MDHTVGERIRVTRSMGLRLRTAREKKGLTQRQLADRLQASYQQIDQYEHGDLDVAVERLFSMAEILGITVAELFDP